MEEDEKEGEKERRQWRRVSEKEGRQWRRVSE